MNNKVLEEKKDGSIYTRISLYMLSFIFAYGPINPFAINGYEEEEASSPFLTILTGLFLVCFFLFDYKCLKEVYIKRLAFPLMIFVVSMLLGDILYDIGNADYFFMIKLSVCVVASIMLYTYYVKYPQMIERCLIIYSISCLSIIAMLYTGVLNSFAEVHNGRLWLFGENPNNTSSRISMAIIILYFYGSQYKNKIIRVSFFILCGIFLYYIIQSGSRGSFIATLLGIGLMWVSASITNKERFFQFFVLLCVFLMLSIIVRDNKEIGLFDRMQELEEGNVREGHIQNALLIAQDYPIFGCGHNGYIQEKRIREMDFHDSHNILASTFVMSGIIGVGALIYFLIRVFRDTYSSYKKNALCLALFLSMVFIAMKTGGVITYMLMWYIYAITAAMGINKFKKIVRNG